MATKIDLREEYFRWLCGKVKRRRSADRDHWILLKLLYDTEFTCKVPNDDNRICDGLKLREYFGDEVAPNADCPELDERRFPCSILEMLVGLACRMEGELYDPRAGDRTAEWFWEMMNNLGLIPMLEGDDRLEEKEKLNVIKLERFVDRRYAKNGRGGLFPLKHPKEDQREVEIWYQLQDYLEESYPS